MKAWAEKLQSKHMKGWISSYHGVFLFFLSGIGANRRVQRREKNSHLTTSNCSFYKGMINIMIIRAVITSDQGLSDTILWMPLLLKLLHLQWLIVYSSIKLSKISHKLIFLLTNSLTLNFCETTKIYIFDIHEPHFPFYNSDLFSET